MVEYCFYLNAYHGSAISQEEWPAFETQAAARLARYKQMYVVTVPEASSEAMAVCAMADALAYFTAVQNGSGGSVASASIGSVSVSYCGAASLDLSAKGQEKELYRCARQYLRIYRGAGPCLC